MATQLMRLANHVTPWLVARRRDGSWINARATDDLDLPQCEVYEVQACSPDEVERLAEASRQQKSPNGGV